MYFLIEYSIIPEFSITFLPVDTWRRFNVYKTSIRRLIDVETTSCFCWARTTVIIVSVDFENDGDNWICLRNILRGRIYSQILKKHQQPQYNNKTVKDYNWKNSPLYRNWLFNFIFVHWQENLLVKKITL